MKKMIFLLVCILPMMAFVSCNEELDLPDVDFALDITGGTIVDGKIYGVVGETLSVDAIRVINHDQGKDAGILYADYFWNYCWLGRSNCPPNGFKITLTKDMVKTGQVLEIYAPVYAIDKDAAFAYMIYPVYVVNSIEDLPNNGKTRVIASPEMSEMDNTPKR